MLASQALVLLEHYRYLVLFPLAVLEGPLVTVIAGFLVTVGLLDALPVYAIVVLGDLIGDSAWYAAGRFGQGRLIPFMGRYLGITPDKIARAAHAIDRRSFRMIALAKLSHGIGVAGMVAAGLLGMSFPRFLATCLVVALGQAALFLVLGTWFGQAYEAIGGYLRYFAAGSIVVGICAIAVVTWHLMRRSRTTV